MMVDDLKKVLIHVEVNSILWRMFIRFMFDSSVIYKVEFIIID